jgi:hypothetical protein
MRMGGTLASDYRRIMRPFRGIHLLWLLGMLVPLTCQAQIDPYKRRLLQFGYNQPIEGRGPIAGYAFYYFNQPNLAGRDLTLRLAVAPTYLDSELGFSHALGRHTDLAVGLAGGGFADSYSEIRLGRLRDAESFTGHGGHASVSLYHRFNPNQRIPLNGILSGMVDYSVYERDDDTADTFELPSDHTTLQFRTGLRWGGREPLMTPRLGMELSAWYEGQLRNEHGTYGFAGDRFLEANSHRFWGRALLAYTLPRLEHTFNISLTAGTTANPDRFSAYRLGASLPLVSEFRLDLPGYYYQEISARQFLLFNGWYVLPVDAAKRWNITAFGAVAGVDYLAGLEQSGKWHSGVGAGVGYISPRRVWQAVLAYAYGFDAVRSHGRGAQSIVLLLQYDFEARRRETSPSPLDPVLDPGRARGLERWFEGVFGR